MRHYEFHLSITPEDYLDYYRGTVKVVVARSLQGEVLQFPASLLVPFVTHGGIHGTFVLTCGDDFKRASLDRLQT